MQHSTAQQVQQVARTSKTGLEQTSKKTHMGFGDNFVRPSKWHDAEHVSEEWDRTAPPVGHACELLWIDFVLPFQDSTAPLGAASSIQRDFKAVVWPFACNTITPCCFQPLLGMQNTHEFQKENCAFEAVKNRAVACLGGMRQDRATCRAHLWTTPDWCCPPFQLHHILGAVLQCGRTWSIGH